MRSPRLLLLNLQPALVTVAVLGSVSGLPLMLTGGTLQAWMKSEGVDLGWIGLFALTGVPYSVKFLWSPLLDRYRPPFGGRRRGWIFVMTLAIMGLLALMALFHPGAGLWPLAILAVLIAFCSASADINIDAYRMEAFGPREVGLATSLHLTSLRVSMILAGALALWLSDRVSWPVVYLVLALGLVPGALAALLAREPQAALAPRTLREAVVGPFADFFGRKRALEILGFILFFKLGDGLATALNIPFLLALGFTRSEIALAANTYGLGALLAGGVASGWLTLRFQLAGLLWILGGLQLAGILLTAALAHRGTGEVILVAVIILENSVFAMGTIGLLTVIQRFCAPGQAATQFAFLVSLTALARVLFAAPAGFLAQRLGWTGFFLGCAVLALPGLGLLLRLPSWHLPGAPPEGDSAG